MSTNVTPVNSIERALLSLLVRDLPRLEGSDDHIGGDMPGDIDDFYVRIDRVPGGRSDAFEGTAVVDLESFSQDYAVAERVSYEIEVVMLRHGIITFDAQETKWVFDSVFQSSGPADLPWDGDDDTYRFSSTYVIGWRRRPDPA